MNASKLKIDPHQTVRKPWTAERSDKLAKGAFHKPRIREEDGIAFLNSTTSVLKATEQCLQDSEAE